MTYSSSLFKKIATCWCNNSDAIRHCCPPWPISELESNSPNVLLLSALVKTSTFVVQHSTSCLKTHYGAWTSGRGAFAWVYFELAFLVGVRGNVENLSPNRSWRSATNSQQWLLECAGARSSKTLKTICICCFYRKGIANDVNIWNVTYRKW